MTKVDNQANRRRLQWIWLLALLAFFLLGAGWATALPVNGTYDEKQHVVRAYAVATGQWLPTGTAREESFVGTAAFRVPRSLLPGDPHCLWYPKLTAASCQRPVTERTKTFRTSAAATYNPVYYLPVGLPMVISPNYAGIVAGRLISALLDALLLASAVVTAVRLGNRMLVAAIALVSTPLVMNLNGSINPNGLEIAAGVLLFTTLLALLRGGNVLDERATRRLVWHAGTAIGLLLTLRFVGPLLLAVNVCACLVLAPPRRLRTLVKRRDARWIIGVTTLISGLFALGWMLVAITTEGFAGAATRAENLNRWQVAEQIATRRVPFYISQTVGQFGYGETHIHPIVILVWYGLVAAVLVPALRGGERRMRLVIGGLLLFCAVLLVGLDAYLVRSWGWFSHGRYALPTAVGVVIVAAFASTRRNRPTSRYRPSDSGRFSRSASFLFGTATVVVSATSLVWATVPLHEYALAVVLTRYRSGANATLDPFTGPWTPLWGALPPLVATLVGGLLLGWLTIHAQRPAAREPTEPPAAPRQAAPPSPVAAPDPARVPIQRTSDAAERQAGQAPRTVT